jgi:hypothetical protein
MYWRIKFDVPHSFAVERGYRDSRYSPDFRSSATSFINTWQCPVTKVVMLEPTIRSRDFGGGFRSLNNFRRTEANATYWRNLAKSIDSLAMFTSLRPTGALTYAEPLAVAAAIKTINAIDALFDNLIWSLESYEPIPVDGSFAIHYQGLTDELLRKNNWMYLQWDDIGIHISHGGHVRVCWYPDRGHIEVEPDIVHEFDIAEPGELLGKSGYFTFIPIPGRGLAMYHSQGQSRQEAFSANSASFAVRGAHLIPWGARQFGQHFRLFDASLIRIALNPFHSNVLGFQDVLFQASGTYLDGIFSPDYRPTLDPNDVSALVLPSFSENFATTGATLRNSDSSGNWTAGTDRQGRILFNLATSDNRYSPFVYGWGVEWLPVLQVRDTEEIIVTNGPADVLQRLEMTDDSEGHWEGTAVVKVETPELIRAMERGQTTFQVEYSADNAEWTVYNGGIAKVEKPLAMESHPDWGFFWQAEVVLCDMHERFRAQKNAVGTAFNDRTIAESINLVLSTAGFEQIDEDDFPVALFFRRLPPIPEDADQFPLSPKGGDRYDKILRVLLFLASQQYLEWKLIYLWEDEGWAVFERDRDFDNFWILTYEEIEEDFLNLKAYYEDVKLQPGPPEGNVLVVTGLSSSDPQKAKRIQSAPLRNAAGTDDPDSIHYSGWVDPIEVLVEGLTDQAEVDRAARTIAPRALYRNQQAIISLSAGHFTLELQPDVAVRVTLPPETGQTADRLIDMWIKKRTIIVDEQDHGAVEGMANERIILHLDETWENSFPGEKR